MELKSEKVLWKESDQFVKVICHNNPAQSILKLPTSKIWEGLCLTL